MTKIYILKNTYTDRLVAVYDDKKIAKSVQKKMNKGRETSWPGEIYEVFEGEISEKIV